MEFWGNKFTPKREFVVVIPPQKSIISLKYQKLCGNPTLGVIKLARLWLNTIFCGEIAHLQPLWNTILTLTAYFPKPYFTLHEPQPTNNYTISATDSPFRSNHWHLLYLLTQIVCLPRLGRHTVRTLAHLQV